MGFFDNFMNELKDTKAVKEVLEIDRDAEEDMSYREIAVRNTQSNYGWYTCPKCGRNFRLSDMDADHILPQSYGGSDSAENLQLLCKHCNRSKQDDVSETMQDLKRRKQELKQQDKNDAAFLKDILKQERSKRRN